MDAARAAQKLVDEIGERASSYVIGPLEDSQVPARLIAETITRFGRIDCLVNKPRRQHVGGNLENTNAQAFDRIVAINLRAPFLLIQAALPYFPKAGWGPRAEHRLGQCLLRREQLVCLFDLKGGLMTLTRNLADAHGAEGIRINQLNVGWTLTPNEFALKMKEGLSDDWPTKLPKTFAPSGRLLSPEDIAGAAVYFLSDEASLINGTILDVEQYPLIGEIRRKRLQNFREDLTWPLSRNVTWMSFVSIAP